jgi:hypothetical protein
MQFVYGSMSMYVPSRRLPEVAVSPAITIRGTMSASYRIVCVDRPESASEHRRHVTGIGTVEPDGAKRHWNDIGVVRAAMADGDSFYTKSHATEKTAPVEMYDCPCGAKTVRSNPDHVADNNLDNMIPCPGRRSTKQ